MLQTQLPLALVESTKSLFATMLQAPVAFGTPALCDHPSMHDVSAIVSYSGDVRGSVVLGLSMQASIDLGSRLAGTPLEVGSPDLTDAIGEVINIIAGGAKSRLNAGAISMTCPSIIHAPGHIVRSPGTVGCVCIPCKSGHTTFNLYCIFQSIPKAAVHAA